MKCSVGLRCGSDLVWLWLWCQMTAAAPIQPLAWTSICCGFGPKKTERQKWRKGGRKGRREGGKEEGRKGQIKPQWHDHFTLTRMAITKTADNSKCWWGYGEIGTPMTSWWECKWCNCLEKGLAVPQKLKRHYSFIKVIPGAPGGLAVKNSVLSLLCLGFQAWEFPHAVGAARKKKKIKVIQVYYSTFWKPSSKKLNHTQIAPSRGNHRQYFNVFLLNVFFSVVLPECGWRHMTFATLPLAFSFTMIKWELYHPIPKHYWM